MYLVNLQLLDPLLAFLPSSRCSRDLSRALRGRPWVRAFEITQYLTLPLYRTNTTRMRTPQWLTRSAIQWTSLFAGPLLAVLTHLLLPPSYPDSQGQAQTFSNRCLSGIAPPYRTSAARALLPTRRALRVHPQRPALLPPEVLCSLP